MTRISRCIASGAIAATFAFGQATQTPAGQAGASGSGSKGDKKFQGVLMDGSCRAIKDSPRSRSRPDMEGPSASATGINPDQPGQPAPRPGERASERAGEAASERSRAAAGAMADSFGGAPVPSQYDSCKVTSSTTSFGLYSNGKVYMVDDPESAVRNKVHVKSPTGWHQISVMGNVQGDRIQVTSVK